MPSAVDFRKQIAVPSLFTILEVALKEITFSIRKGENLAWEISSKYSITVNLGKSAVSFSESNSDVP